MLEASLFINRLEQIIIHYELSSTALADKVQVPRSSISHILNGRNKPSLDFVMKINDNFKEVELSWLLYGKGDFPSISSIDKNSKKVAEIKTKAISKDTTVKSKQIDKVILFYTDGTFTSYKED